ncbi:hypothetical protein [Streptomyces beigongshangae]|uniref:hypothetical protein n=1 Tax=Streptomyces beigongshangae TaxID=2841597 RepID=UPI001C841F4A|nr:hypothetical protein [Streptomyces sp. REN17]
MNALDSLRLPGSASGITTVGVTQYNVAPIDSFLQQLPSLNGSVSMSTSPAPNAGPIPPTELSQGPGL